MEETGCEIICGVPTTLAVKGQMMMMKSEYYMMQFFFMLLTFCYWLSDDPRALHCKSSESCTTLTPDKDERLLQVFFFFWCVCVVFLFFLVNANVCLHGRSRHLRLVCTLMIPFPPYDKRSRNGCQYGNTHLLSLVLSSVFFFSSSSSPSFSPCSSSQTIDAGSCVGILRNINRLKNMRVSTAGWTGTTGSSRDGQSRCYELFTFSFFF